MSRSESIISERETGQFPITIGTSLALEGGLGIYPEQEQDTAPLTQFNALWVNVATLFRNIFHTFSADQRDKVHSNDIAMALAGELPAIVTTLQEHLGNDFKVVFYHNTRRSLNRFFPNAIFRHPQNNKQRIYQSLEQNTLQLLPRYIDIEIQRYDVRINGISGDTAAMLTHLPVDLLSKSHFGDLQLLESHTGKLRPSTEWGGKLHVRDETLPFTPVTLQIFGDHTDIMPQPIRYRRVVLDAAKRERWNATTRERRIRSFVRAADDEIQKALLPLFDYRDV